jgi:type II restriction enzyme
MIRSVSEIDIIESKLSREGILLDVLLIDRTTGKNIIWATDSYEQYGERFAADKKIIRSLITGKFDRLIQPRAAKSREEQQKRTKEKAEVFTPLKIIDQMNKTVDKSGKFKRITKNNWQEYVQQVWLEITCGEGPFIVSRYDPTAHAGEIISLEKRVGFLDKKLRIISEYCENKKDWFFWAKKAFQSSYGYDWQGDNILLVRENLLYTFIDYYEDKFGQIPTQKLNLEIAEIISWNIFQMDGLKYVIPLSNTCVKIMDWKKKEIIRFDGLVAA